MLYEHSLWTFYQVQKMVDMQWAGLEYADTQSTLLFKQFIFSRKFSSLFKKKKKKKFKHFIPQTCQIFKVF